MTQKKTSIPPHTPSYLCEFAHRPFADCYCRNVSGRTVPNVVLYCMERYSECPVYRQHLQQETPRSPIKTIQGKRYKC